MKLDEARAKSKAIWDDMAEGWERQSDYIWEASRPVGEWMVDRLDPKPGQTILELAAGPGITGFGAARLVGESGKLISTDFSPQMVEVARRTAGKLGVTNAEFRVMDAEKMDLPDDSIDGVLCRWGYMLMMDPASALAETRRVLGPGGGVALSVWGTPQDNPWASMPGMIMVTLGLMEMPDPKAPGSIFSMSERDVIESLLKDAGFESIDVAPMPVTWRFGDFPELWSFLIELAGPIALTIRTLKEESIAIVKKTLQEQAKQFFRDGEGYVFPGVALNVIAR